PRYPKLASRRAKALLGFPFKNFLSFLARRRLALERNDRCPGRSARKRHRPALLIQKTGAGHCFFQQDPKIVLVRNLSVEEARYDQIGGNLDRRGLTKPIALAAGAFERERGDIVLFNSDRGP